MLCYMKIHIITIMKYLGKASYHKMTRLPKVDVINKMSHFIFTILVNNSHILLTRQSHFIIKLILLPFNSLFPIRNDIFIFWHKILKFYVVLFIALSEKKDKIKRMLFSFIEMCHSESIRSDALD